MKRFRIFDSHSSTGGFGSNKITTHRTRVVEIGDDEQIPTDAVTVSDTEPLTDWVIDEGGKIKAATAPADAKEKK